MTTPAARDRLIVALDVATVDDAREIVARLGDAVTFYKVGLELLFAGGLAFAEELKREGKSVFLDMKLLDIANTVERATAQIAGLGVDLLTIHGTDRKTMAAARRGRGAAPMKLLAVTVLTNLDAHDLEEQGIGLSPADLVIRRARLAADAGLDGVVASGQEAAAIRAEVPPGFLIVTPGIRLPTDAAGDQTRVVTPEAAISAGASHLVVGRPITRAADPAEAARIITGKIAEAAH